MKKSERGTRGEKMQKVRVKIKETKKAAKQTHFVQNSRETYH